MIITIAIVSGIVVLVIVRAAPNSKKKTTVYAFQVYDNMGRYVYTKRVNAASEYEACGKIEKYIPKDYTYQIVFREL